MIKSLKIRNFQSHSKTDIALSPSVNIIVGKNDSGKTAIFRSLRKLFRDLPQGTSFITKGESTTAITGEIEDCLVTREVFRSKTGRYVVEHCGNDPQVYSGFKSDIPREVVEALGVSGPLEIDNTTIDLNFKGQHDESSLLGLPNSVKSKLISIVSGLFVFDQAARVAKTTLSNAKQSEGTLIEAITTSTSNLDRYLTIVAFRPDIDRIKSEFNTIITKHSQVLIPAKDKLETLRSVAARGRQIAAALTGLPNLAQVQDRVSACQQTATLLHTAQQYRSQLRLLAIKITASESIAGLSIPDMPDDILVKITSKRAAVNLYNKLVVVDSQLQTATAAASSIDKDITQITARLDTVKQSLQNTACPTCGQLFTSDALNHLGH